MSQPARPVLDVEDVSIDLGGHRVVDNVSFSLADGEIGSLLGPSGCGKTTILRAIAGFQPLGAGRIRVRGQLVSGDGKHVAPERRSIGMVFQDLALFPHLTVNGNVSFGIRKQGAGDIRRRVGELLELVGLSEHADKYPHELSGGQQQRVALVRAMAPRPGVLLLDEPFSGQDLELREQLAREVREVLRQDRITALLVTHDQFEAFAFSDVMGVINKGKLHQWDSAYNLYHRPADRFIAEFVGHGAFVGATVLEDNRLDTGLGVLNGHLSAAWPAGTRVDLLLRPDDVRQDPDGPIRARVASRAFRGADHLYTLVAGDNVRVLCLAPSHQAHQPGDEIGIRLDLKHFVVFPRTGSG